VGCHVRTDCLAGDPVLGAVCGLVDATKEWLDLVENDVDRVGDHRVVDELGVGDTELREIVE